MSRAIDLSLVPAQHAEHLSVQAYTYAYTPDIPFAAMRETVHLDADSDTAAQHPGKVVIALRDDVSDHVSDEVPA